MPGLARFRSGRAQIGTNTSVRRPTSTPEKPWLTTPTIGSSSLSRRIVLPTTSAAPPNSLRQKAKLMTAPGAPHPRTSSAGSMSRPRAARPSSAWKNPPLTKSPSARRDSPPDDMSNDVAPHANMSVSDWPPSRIFSQSGLVSEGLAPWNEPVRPLLFGAIRTSTICSGWRSGSVRRRTMSSSWKIAAFAPIPSASDRSATAANPGLRRSTRAPYRRSCQTDSSQSMVFMR